MDLEGKGRVSRFSGDFAEIVISQLIILRKNRSYINEHIRRRGGNPPGRGTAYVRAQRPSLPLSSIRKNFI